MTFQPAPQAPRATPGLYAQNLAAAAAAVERNAKKATLQDYYRARSYREMAGHYARLADEKAAELVALRRAAGTIEQALATLELAGADQLSEAGVAYLCDIALKFLADRTAPCALAQADASTRRSVLSLINHLTEAYCRSVPPMDFNVAIAMAAYSEQRRAA